MYGWLWGKLPGPTAAKAVWMTLIILAVVAVLWFVVFPWAQLHLPIDGSTVG